MAPEAEAFEFVGYQNPTAKIGQRTYVSVQGIGIIRRSGEGLGSFFTTGPLQNYPLPQPGVFAESAEEVVDGPMDMS